MSQKCKKLLTLKEKIEVIERMNVESLSIRKAAAIFKIGKTQISEIYKNREDLLIKWQNGVNPSEKKCFKSQERLKIDQKCFDWFSKARSQNVPISGEVIKAKAKDIARNLNVVDFKASNGWLEKWRKRHSISFKSISGESAAVRPEDEEEFKKKLPALLIGYKSEDIFNADESGIFFRALPNKTLHFKGETCSGGKMSKERLSVLFCASMVGEKLPLLVIGKAAKPRAFKNIRINNLPVIWKSNKKAWMTRDIMSEWLRELDRKMSRQNRKILLFLDNAASHPRDLKLQNIKILFLPPNLTSVCQPLDQGVIKNFKFYYREFLIKHLLAAMDSVQNSENLKAINILEAIFYIKAAWIKVKSSTIENCFRKAGFIKDDSNIDDVDSENEDNIPLSDLANMLSKTKHLLPETSMLDDYFLIDNVVVTEDDNIECSDEVIEICDLSNECETEPAEVAELPTKITSMNEALDVINDLKLFAMDDYEAYQHVKCLQMHYENRILQQNITNKKQSSITSFFQINSN